MSTRRPPRDPVGPGQTSVWDYPRPPRVEACTQAIEIHLGGRLIAATRSSVRVLETSHPPTYYLPRSAFATGVLVAISGRTWCEYKGEASYFDLVADDVVAPRAAWTYPSPTQGFEPLTGMVAVMPGAVQRCLVDGEVVIAQPGGFYGGWITSQVAGPFKGGPGSATW